MLTGCLQSDVSAHSRRQVLGAIWGITVVSDSAQYSTMVTEVVDKEVRSSFLSGLFRDIRSFLPV